MTRPIARTSILAMAALLLSACSVTTADPGEPAPTGTVDDEHRTVDVGEALGGLPTWTGKFTGRIAVQEGINPPTNSWVAPAVFAPEERPVFTGVLSARPGPSGVAVGLPRPETSARVVMGSHRDDVPLGFDADDYVVTSLDPLSAVLEYRSGGSAVGRLTMAEGWPYLHYGAEVDQRVDLPAAATATADGAVVEVDGTTYRILTEGAVSDGGVDLPAGSDLMLYAEPGGADEETLQALAAGAVPLLGAEVSSSVDPDTAGTTFRYLTEDDADTVVAVLPHHTLDDDVSVLGTHYAGVLGEVRLVKGRELTATVPTRQVSPALDLSSLDDDELAEVGDLLTDDVEALAFSAPDSYHGGKELQRAANLYLLARELGADDHAATVRTAMSEQLDLWFDPAGCTDRAERCFRYDDHLGGLVGEAPSYGSDEFNDHHFHYGHLLYAAGVLAADDPELAERWAPVADLVARDYGAPQASDLFPQHRVFDEWYGHSWASGTAPFADGNNQESSSEAVNAWSALWLWAEASGDEELAEHATWLLSTETATTLAYWVDPGLPEEFGAPSVSLNWQGKRDFATFFTDEPAAVVGIQFIPMTPTHGDYLSDAPEAVTAMVDHVGELTPDRPLVDYDVMALAVVDPERARDVLVDFGADDVDPGNSLSYMTAFVLSR